MTKVAQEKLLPADLLREVRGRFHYVESDPLSGDRVWLESASGSLRLKSVVDVMAEQTRLPDQLGRANPGSRRAGEIMAGGIEDVRLFLGAGSGVIMPAMSSTHAVFRAVNAVMASASATNVVTTNLDHPSVYDSTERFARAYGMQRRVARLDPRTGAVSSDAVLEKVDGGTCLIGIVHSSNITGAVMDVKTITREARRISPDVFVLVDGVQYAPHAPVDVEDLGVDAYVFGPYKAFCVKGIAFAYLSDRLARLDHWKLQGKAIDDWALGSPEDATYAAWSAVVDYLCWLGAHFTESDERRERIVAAMEACDAHLRSLLRRLLQGTDGVPGLLRMGHVTVHGMGDDLSHRACLVLFSLERMDSYQAVELYNRAGFRLHNRVRDAYSRHTLEAMGIPGGVRLSACHYNTPEEIDRFLRYTARLGEMSNREIDAVPGGSTAGGYSEG